MSLLLAHVHQAPTGAHCLVAGPFDLMVGPVPSRYSLGIAVRLCSSDTGLSFLRVLVVCVCVFCVGGVIENPKGQPPFWRGTLQKTHPHVMCNLRI